MQLTAVYRKVPEGYIAYVEELPGANTQGATLEEAQRNVREAIQLVLEANRSLIRQQTGGDNKEIDELRETFVISPAA